MRILVVDDSRISRRAIARILRKQEDAEICEAENGSEAVAAYEAERFDLVIMDLTMPVMSGFDACRAIIAHDPDATIAIVSADIQPLARARCKEAGAFTFVSKPIAPRQIDALVAQARERIAC